MNRSFRKARISLILTIAAMSVSCFSIMIIPLMPRIEKEQSGFLQYAVGTVFWTGLVLSFVTSHITRVILCRKKEYLIDRGYIKRQRLPGIIFFSLNLTNAIIYIITAVGLILIASDIIFDYVSGTVMFPIISITLLSFMLHCVFDGQYYKVYKFIKESIEDETRY